MFCYFFQVSGTFSKRHTCGLQVSIAARCFWKWTGRKMDWQDYPCHISLHCIKSCPLSSRIFRRSFLIELSSCPKLITSVSIALEIGIIIHCLEYLRVKSSGNISPHFLALLLPSSYFRFQNLSKRNKKNCPSLRPSVGLMELRVQIPPPPPQKECIPVRLFVKNSC